MANFGGKIRPLQGGKGSVVEGDEVDEDARNIRTAVVAELDQQAMAWRARRNLPRGASVGDLMKQMGATLEKLGLQPHDAANTINAQADAANVVISEVEQHLKSIESEAQRKRELFWTLSRQQ